MDPTTSRVGARPARLPHHSSTFDGYPYLVTRIGNGPLRHMVVLPADWPRARLLDLAVRQALTNRLETCLCLGPDDAVYVTTDGKADEATFVPFGLPVVDRLVLAERLPERPELAARQMALRRFAALNHGAGYIVGDGLERGELATSADTERLSGRNPEGLPAGLSRCPQCHGLRGDYLALRGEGNGDMRPRVIRVHCRCENHNRCAGCGEALAEWRLSSYLWNEVKAKVSYQAAYSALSHRCRTEAVSPVADEPRFFVTGFDPSGTMMTARKVREHLTLAEAKALQAEATGHGGMLLIYKEKETPKPEDITSLG